MKRIISKAVCLLCAGALALTAAGCSKSAASSSTSASSETSVYGNASDYDYQNFAYSDGLDENGECPIGDDGTDMMISYNHYASGAVGAFLYRRVLGVEPTEAGYRKFKFAPVVGGGITEAEGTVGTPYGVIKAAWKIADGEMTMTVAVPVGTECTVVPPSGEEKALGSGEYTVTAKA